MTLVVYEGPDASASFLADGQTFIAARGVAIDVPLDVLMSLPSGWVRDDPGGGKGREFALEGAERRAAADRQLSSAQARAAYEDAVTNEWYDALSSSAAWTTAGAPTISGGKWFSPTSGVGIATRPIVWLSNGRARVVARFTWKNTAGLSGATMGIGVTDRTAAQLNALDFSHFIGIGIQYDGTGNHRKVKFNVNGVDTYFAAIPVTDNVPYTMGVNSDDTGWYSVWIRRADGTYFEQVAVIGPGTPNPGTWTPDKVAFFGVDSRGQTGSGVGPVSFTPHLGSLRTKTSLEGLAGVDTVICPRNETTTEVARIALPPNYDSRVPAPVVFFLHGGNMTGGEVGLNGNTFQPEASVLTAAGCIVASPFGAYAPSKGNNMGGRAGIDALRDLYRWMRTRFNLGPVFLWGFSMGGLWASNAASERVVPVTGIITSSPSFNLDWFWDHRRDAAVATYENDIEALYGVDYDVTTKAQWLNTTAPYHPYLKARIDPAVFRGVPWLMFASQADTAAIASVQSDLMRPLLDKAGVEVTYVAATGDHGDPSQFSGATIRDWILARAYS